MQVRTSKSGRSQGRRKSHAVGGDDRHAKRRRQIDQLPIGRFLVAAEVPLHFDIGPVAAEQADDPIEQSADAELIRLERRPADERHQPRGRAIELVERQRTFAFRRIELHARDHATEIAISLGALAQHWQ
jgi:hypothetical protein